MGWNHVLLIMPAKIFCPRESRWRKEAPWPFVADRGNFMQLSWIQILLWLRAGYVFRGLEFNSIIKGIKAGWQYSVQVFWPHLNLPFLRGKAKQDDHDSYLNFTPFTLSDSLLSGTMSCVVFKHPLFGYYYTKQRQLVLLFKKEYTDLVYANAIFCKGRSIFEMAGNLWWKRKQSLNCQCIVLQNCCRNRLLRFSTKCWKGSDNVQVDLK